MGPLSLLKSNVRDLTNDPKGYLQMVADRMHNSVMGQRAVANREGLGMRKLSPSERTQQIQQAILDNSGGGSLGGALGVIKPRGGNWLTGSVEHALKELKKSGPFGSDSPEELAAMLNLPVEDTRYIWASSHSSPINRWIEGPLTKYVKRDMATEGDPVRKLAEQGILHYVPEPSTGEFIHPTQKFMGKSRLAQDWEEVADLSLDQHLAGEVPSWVRGSKDDWLDKLDPATPVYQAGSSYGRESGFRHLVDELQNALNPDSGLPRNLRLTPEQMQQMSMEKAVRHVADINAWRAAQQAEINAKLAQSPAVHTFKEYAENNPKGLRWVEIKQPKIPEGYQVKFDDDSRIWSLYDDKGNKVPQSSGQSKEEALSSHGYDQLEEQLKYEGDTMGHCVGGYCDDVIEGHSRIFSLRDAKGEPHVTIETAPIEKSFEEFERLNPEFSQHPIMGYDEWIQHVRKSPEYAAYLKDQSPRSQDIVQIKGKANTAPKDEYVPFIQDFIKSGSWGSVRDLQNAQMWKNPHTGQYHTRAEAEVDEDLQAIYDSRNLDANGNYVGGYAEGGRIPTREEYLRQLGVTFQD